MIDGQKVLPDLLANYNNSRASKNRIDSNIQKWLRAYNGDKYGNEVKGRSSIVMKDVKKVIKAMSPSLIEPFMATDTMVRAKPVRLGLENVADYEADVLNYQWNNQFDKLEFITSIATILPKEGTVFVRTGWDFKERAKKKTLRNLGVQELQVIQQQNPSIENVEDNGDGTYNVTISKKEAFVNKPTAKICKNEAITVDPTASSFKEAKFITYEYEKSLSDLKREKDIYDYQPINENLLTAQQGDYPETPLGGQRAYDNYNSGVDYTFGFADKSSKKVKIIEYWGEYDINGDGINEQIVCAWIKGTDKILRLDENPYPDYAIPFVSCQFGFEPFTVWGNSVADLIGDNQQIHTAIMRGFIDNMSLSNNGQKFFQKGAIDYVNLGKLARGEKYIELNNLAGMTDGSYNQLPQSSFQVYDMLTSESEMLTGTNRNMDGIDSATVGRSASGLNMVMSAAQRHMVIMVRVISDMLKDLLGKWSSYNSEFLDEGQAFEISGSLQQIDRSKITGDINIELNVNIDVMNSQRIQQINMLMQQAHQFGNQIPPMVIPFLVAEIFEGFGRYEEAKQIREYQPQPDPAQQQMQQLEMQRLQAEIAKLQAEAQLAQSRSGEADSKSIKHQAETDHIDTKTMVLPAEVNMKDKQVENQATKDFVSLAQAQKEMESAKEDKSEGYVEE